MSALDELRHVGTAWQNRPQLIEQARQEGDTWQAIADALHMTRQGVVKLHATLTKPNESPEMTDTEWALTFVKESQS